MILHHRLMMCDQPPLADVIVVCLLTSMLLSSIKVHTASHDTHTASVGFTHCLT